jgi:hypothetical protein
MIGGLDSVLKHSWGSSLFADVDPKTAAGAIIGVYGPSGLFTTTQVDNVRRVFKEMLIGRDAVLGIYPIERCRWISYVGIMTGLDIPQKVRRLLETAREEHQLHEEVLKERKAQKAMGLGFKLRDKHKHQIAPVTAARLIPRLSLESGAAYVANRKMDISSTMKQIMEVIEREPMGQMTDEEFINHILMRVEASEEEVLACILRLKDMGCIIEPRNGILQVL